MAPNQGDGVSVKAQAIATAFERGVSDPTHNMKGAIDALQQAAHGSPQEYREVLQLANQKLDASGNANVKNFFGKFDIVGGDNQAMVLKRNDGAMFKMDAQGKTSAENGAQIEATQRDAAGNRVEKVTDKDGTVRERVTSADGKMSLEKYTDKTGNHWEIERRKQADETLRPTKVTMPDGSKMEYEWNREMGDHGTLYPTHMRETNSRGSVIRDYQMKTLEGTNRFNTAGWDKKVGPSADPKEFYGTIVVDSAGNNTLTMRDPYMVQKVNADGNWTRTSFDKMNKVTDGGRRTK